MGGGACRLDCVCVWGGYRPVTEPVSRLRQWGGLLLVEFGVVRVGCRATTPQNPTGGGMSTSEVQHGREYRPGMIPQPRSGCMLVGRKSGEVVAWQRRGSWEREGCKGTWLRALLNTQYPSPVAFAPRARPETCTCRTSHVWRPRDPQRVCDTPTDPGRRLVVLMAVLAVWCGCRRR